MSYFSVSVSYFVVWILWPELQIYWQGVRFFDKFEKITHELNFENLKFLQILTFCRILY